MQFDDIGLHVHVETHSTSVAVRQTDRQSQWRDENETARVMTSLWRIREIVGGKEGDFRRHNSGAETLLIVAYHSHVTRAVLSK